MPHGIVRSQPRQSAADMAIPDGDFSPASVKDEGYITATSYPMGNQHPLGYAALVTGYGVYAALNDIDFYYQGTVEVDIGSAARDYGNTVNYLTDGDPGAATDCTSTFTVPCTIIGYISTTNYEVVYAIAQVKNCLVEEKQIALPNVYDQYSDTISNIAARVIVDGVAHGKAACSGSSAPQPTVTPTPRPSPTATRIPSPTASPTATATATATSTAMPTATAIPAPPTLKVTVSGMPHARHTGTLRVTVRRSDDTRTVAGAQVLVDARTVGIAATRRATTDRQGRALFGEFSPIHVGRVTIRVSKSGFTSRTVHVTVST